jgi:hypothetical protein
MPTPLLNDPVAAQCALLAMYAEDMFDPHPSHWNPTSASVAGKGWTIVGYLTAANAFLDGQKLGLGERVYFGFLAQSTTLLNQFVAVVRGTEQFIEWMENIEGVLVPHPSVGRVEQGFFSIYRSMHYTPATAAAPIVTGGPGDDPKGAAGIAAVIPAGGTVTVIGHSLGSALGTYLMLDVAVAAAGRFNVAGAFFASPNAGNSAFVQNVDKIAPNYKLYDYVFDLVPHVPPRLPADPLDIGFHPLPKAVWITNNNRQARIKQDVLCNHHAYCYAAMLDFTSVAPGPAVTCVVGKA